MLSLRRYDQQATASVIVSVASIITMLGMVVLIIRNFDSQEMLIYYGKSTFRLLFLGLTALTMGLSTAGFGLGLNSVGQRRNEKQRLSWIGFFIGAAVLSLSLVLFYLFWTRSENIPV